jgi:small-conductance mechanosensitive channel
MMEYRFTDDFIKARRKKLNICFVACAYPLVCVLVLLMLYGFSIALYQPVIVAFFVLQTIVMWLLLWIDKRRFAQEWLTIEENRLVFHRPNGKKSTLNLKKARRVIIRTDGDRICRISIFSLFRKRYLQGYSDMCSIAQHVRNSVPQNRILER